MRRNNAVFSDLQIVKKKKFVLGVKIPLFYFYATVPFHYLFPANLFKRTRFAVLDTSVIHANIWGSLGGSDLSSEGGEKKRNTGIRHDGTRFGTIVTGPIIIQQRMTAPRPRSWYAEQRSHGCSYIIVAAHFT